MPERAFFDTNVLLYAVAGSDDRTPAAEALLSAGGVVSVQVLNELASVASRTLGMAWDDVVEALAAVRTLCPSPVPITVETHDAALDLVTRHNITTYDALIVAAALEAGCNVLYSEDLQVGKVIDRRLTIRNPFVRR